MDRLLKDIEAFIAARRMSATEFGRQALNDSDFVHGLRRGRDVRLSTVERVRDFMTAYADQ